MENTIAPNYAMELGDYLLIFRRRKAIFITVFSLIMVVGLAIALILPPVYRSEATILIEKQEIPQNLVATTVTGYVQERIEGIKQRLVTYANLIELATSLGLYPEMREAGDTNEMVSLIRKSISVDMIDIKAGDARKPGTATVAFTVGFESDTAEVAQLGAAELSRRYLEENKAARSEQTAEVYEFLGKEAEKLRIEIEELEKVLATFKQEQREQLPELMNVNLKLYEKTEEKIEDSKERILKLEDSIAALRAELSLTDPRKAVKTDEGKIIQSPSERLNALTAEFLQASTRYTPTHPDIIRLRREMQTLGGQSKSAAEANQFVSKLTVLRTKLLDAKQHYSDDHPDVQRLMKSVSTVETKLRNIVITDPSGSSYKNVPPDNPRYVALKTQINSAYSNLKEEKAKLIKFNEKLQEYEKRLFQTPVVERDYQSLSRDYANAKAKYQELKDKQLQARLAEQLEAGEKGERFVLEGKAYLPTSPDKPNRLGIVLLAGLLAFSGGLGSVASAEYGDRSVRGSRGVLQYFGALPIAIIPYIQNSADITSKNRHRLLRISIILTLLILVLLSIHYGFKPLDEIWQEVSQQEEGVNK